MPRARGRRNRRRLAVGWRVVLISGALLAAGLGILTVLDQQMRPILCAVASAQLKNELTMESAKVWAALKEEDGFSLADVMEVHRNGDGSIAALTTDMDRLSRLSSALSIRLTEHFGEMERETISVPIGTVLSVPMISDLGGNVDMEIVDVGQVGADLYKDVTSVGINQTIYEIRLRVTVDMTLLLPGGMETLTVESDGPLAETVLMGEVPQQYVTIEGSRSASDSAAEEEK